MVGTVHAGGDVGVLAGIPDVVGESLPLVADAYTEGHGRLQAFGFHGVRPVVVGKGEAGHGEPGAVGEASHLVDLTTGVFDQLLHFVWGWHLRSPLLWSSSCPQLLQS